MLTIYKIVVVIIILGWLSPVKLQSRNYGSEQWPRDYEYYRPRVNPSVCSSQTCRLPKCFCAGKEAPRQMDPGALPQMVMFTFDDAVNEQVYDYYEELFPEDILNPNGCPVSITFFISHNWTDYNMVKELYDRGHEIGSHSITHRMPQSWWRYGPAEDWEREIQGQRENLAQLASIPEEEIRGMRAPFLDTGGDEQYKMMEKHGFEYDASFMTGPHDKGGAWPFTLDFVPSWEYCTNLNCPKERHPRIWEVPLNRWVGIDGNGCSMVDACQQQPRHKGETLAYLWQNFNRHYYGNRSPVGVNMHATWFKTPHHFEAMKEFVQKISEMEDVYILSVSQILEWMKNPQTIDRVVNFKPWLKSCKGSEPRVTKEINNVLPNIVYNAYEDNVEKLNTDFSNESPSESNINNRPMGRGNRFGDTSEGQIFVNDNKASFSQDRSRSHVGNTNEISADSNFEMYLEESMEKEEILLPKGKEHQGLVSENNDYLDYANEKENEKSEYDITDEKGNIDNSDKHGPEMDDKERNLLFESKSKSEIVIINEQNSLEKVKDNKTLVNMDNENHSKEGDNIKKINENKDTPPTRPPIRQRPRLNRNQRPGSVQGRSDLQSRYRNNSKHNSASSVSPAMVNVMVLAASGKLAVYVYHQLAWV